MIIATMTSIIVQRVWSTISLFDLVQSFVCYYVIVTEAAILAQLETLDFQDRFVDWLDHYYDDWLFFDSSTISFCCC